MSLPFFKIWVKDFLGDSKVAAMSTEEVGAYFLLLLHAWQEQPPATLPNDDIILARLARIDAGRWQACRDSVLPCFAVTRDGRRLVQHRLLAEYEAATEKQSKRSEAGKKGAQAKWQSHGIAIDLPMAKTCDSGSDYSTSSEEKGEVGKEKPRSPPIKPEERPECWLTRVWVFYFAGTQRSERDHERLDKFFADLIASGWAPVALEEAIRDLERPKRQTSWDFDEWLKKRPPRLKIDESAIADRVRKERAERAREEAEREAAWAARRAKSL